MSSGGIKDEFEMLIAARGETSLIDIATAFEATLGKAQEICNQLVNEGRLKARSEVRSGRKQTFYDVSEQAPVELESLDKDDDLSPSKAARAKRKEPTTTYPTGELLEREIENFREENKRLWEENADLKHQIEAFKEESRTQGEMIDKLVDSNNAMRNILAAQNEKTTNVRSLIEAVLRL